MVLDLVKVQLEFCWWLSNLQKTVLIMRDSIAFYLDIAKAFDTVVGIEQSKIMEK